MIQSFMKKYILKLKIYMTKKIFVLLLLLFTFHTDALCKDNNNYSKETFKKMCWLLKENTDEIFLKEYSVDFRNNNQATEDYLEFTRKDFPDKIFTCKAKIDPSACSFVIVFQGLRACAKCKNFADIETVRNSKTENESNIN